MTDDYVDDPIEFIDTAPDAPAVFETVTTSSATRRNLFAGAAALVLVGAGVATLASSGGDSGPPVTVPATVQAPSTTALGDADGDSTVGAGVVLDWIAVDQDVDATTFRWFDDSFFGSGGSVDVLLRPGANGASLSFYGTGDPANDRTIASSSEVFGSSPDDPNVIYFPAQSRRESLEIDAIGPPASKLLTTTTDVLAERIGDVAIVLQTTVGVLDVEVFRQMVPTDVDPIFAVTIDQAAIQIEGDDQAEEVLLADVELSDDDIAALRSLGEPSQRLLAGEVGGRSEPVVVPTDRIDWISVIDEEFVVGGNELWRSSDGVEWAQAVGDTPRVGGLNRPGPDGVLTGLAFEGEDGLLTWSADVGRTWYDVVRPMANTWSIDSAAPVMAMTGWQNDSFVAQPEGWVVLTPNFELRIGGAEGVVELLDRDGRTLASGAVGDPASGFRFLPGSPDIWFEDPETGEEIARFPQSMFASSIAASRTREGQPQLVAFTTVSDPPSAPAPWSLQTVDEIFGPDALAVDFTGGNGWLLADVTTITGRQLYVAEVPEQLRTSSSHPTHAEITGRQTDGD